MELFYIDESEVLNMVVQRFIRDFLLTLKAFRLPQKYTIIWH